MAFADCGLVVAFLLFKVSLTSLTVSRSFLTSSMESCIGLVIGLTASVTARFRLLRVGGLLRQFDVNACFVKFLLNQINRFRPDLAEFCYMLPQT